MLDLTYGVHPAALAVLHLLAPRLPPEGYEHVQIGCTPLYNGRERGLCLSVLNGSRLLLFFAEDRCSDDLFVWEEIYDPASDIDRILMGCDRPPAGVPGSAFALNPPTAKDLTRRGYESRKFFPWNDLVGVARALEARVTEFLGESR